MTEYLISRDDRTGLRRFGLTMAGAIVLLFGLVAPWVLGRGFPAWPWLAGGAFALVALVIPAALWWPYRIWMRFGHLMNWINTRILLGIVFYLLITPVGLVMRLFGKDPMARRIDRAASSYRKPNNDPRDPKGMERMF